MEETKPKKLMFGHTVAGIRKRGRPRNRSKHQVEENLKQGESETG